MMAIHAESAFHGPNYVQTPSWGITPILDRLDQSANIATTKKIDGMPIRLSTPRRNMDGVIRHTCRIAS